MNVGTARRCRRGWSWGRFGELLHAFDGLLHVGVDFVEAATQHPRLLAGVVRDGHRRARLSRSHDVGEPQADAALAGLEVESPTRAWVVGVRGSPSERARFVADVDEAR